MIHKACESISEEACNRASTFEVLAVPGHGSSAASFALALAIMRSKAAILWVCRDTAAIEAGDLYGPGLVRFGIDPARLILARLRTSLDVLRAGHEAARCAAVGVVIIEMKEPIDLTASRRLKLAAEASGCAVILVRSARGDVVVPNAVQMRWRVRAVPSHPCLRHSWQPTLDVTLLKHIDGMLERRELIEWDNEREKFSTAISQSLATVPHGRSLAA
jgi:protein ImuA